MSKRRRPNEHESKRGIIAVMLGKHVSTSGIGYEIGMPYSVIAMNRRIARGDSLPVWIVPNIGH